MKRVTNLLFAAAVLVILHAAFACLLYKPEQADPGIHAFFDSLKTATTVSDMAVDRINVRVEISEAELEEISIQAAILKAEKQIHRQKPVPLQIGSAGDTLSSAPLSQAGQTSYNMK